MITQMSVFSWISAILTGLCFLWLIGLSIFCLVRFIVLKVKAKKEIKKYDDSQGKKTIKCSKNERD